MDLRREHPVCKCKRKYIPCYEYWLRLVFYWAGFYFIMYSEADAQNWGENPYPYVPSELDIISNPNFLYNSFLKSKKGVSWKSSVQRYEINLLSEIAKAHYTIESGEYVPKAPYEFILHERGRQRAIKAVCIEDRVIQRTLNDNLLIPIIDKYLISDNPASRVGMGLSYARNRFVEHLKKYYINNGNSNEGYILFIDFSKYFDNIRHDMMLEMIRPLVSEKIFNFIKIIFDQFKIDVSYMNDDEFARCLDEVFNMVKYDEIDKELLTGEKYMEKSVGIGNQIAQICGLYYPHEIDNYCKIVLGLKYYGRYMDDTYIVAKTKEELQLLLQDLKIKYSQLGIFVNEKKTRILSLTHEVTYLKIRYILKESGKVIQLIPNETFDRYIRKLKKFHNKYLNNQMSLDDIIQSFKSWFGSYYKYDSKQRLYELVYYFKILFNIPTDYLLSPEYNF